MCADFSRRHMTYKHAQTTCNVFLPLREVPLRCQLKDAIRAVDVVLAQSQTIGDLLDFSFARGERFSLELRRNPYFGLPEDP